MTYVAADNILSPLGETTEENYQAVRSGKSALRTYHDARSLLADYTASLFTDEQRSAMACEDLTPFEAMVAASARRALDAAALNAGSDRVVFIVSTTKGDLHHPLGESARRIAATLGITNEPIVVCNACISGLAALILAQRLLTAGLYDHAVVSGGDCQGDFIISGFQSLRALSAEPCRPFDMERNGLNLGEVAATVVLTRQPQSEEQWTVLGGSLHNDAYHVTQPAKRGDGLLLCLEDIKESNPQLLTPNSQLLTLNAHGTATMFNDQMESVAIERAGLSDVPVNALKGYYGHTMGAAGLLETILTMRALDDHIIIGTRGYAERGVSGHVKLSADHQPTEAQAFIKTISGFGGCNAAAVFERGKRKEERGKRTALDLVETHRVSITPEGVVVDGLQQDYEERGLALLTAVYKRLGVNYPKFYKMDALCRLGFVASELLQEKPADCAVVLFNRTSSCWADAKYRASIAADNYYPSPSVFIYTLPNIVTGEIAIRNGFHAETAFYVLPERNDQLADTIVRASLADTATRSVITGWIDFEDDAHFTAELKLIKAK